MLICSYFVSRLGLDARVYTVKHAAAMTGISPATLRMWERRYEVVVPGRSPSGYRVYDEAAVRRLSAMRALVEAGWVAAAGG